MPTARFISTNLPLEKVDSLDQDSLLSLMDEVMYIPIFVYDKTAEGIFSDDIETWKNMGNFQFIDNVGKCFSNMHTIEEEWTAFSEEMDEVRDAVLYHPEQYTGSSWGSKYLNNPLFRQVLRNFHNRKCWLQNNIEKIRYHNYVNMVTIGITEQELLEFIEMREKEVEVDREKPGDIIYTPNINPDSIKIDFFVCLDLVFLQMRYSHQNSCVLNHKPPHGNEGIHNSYTYFYGDRTM